MTPDGVAASGAIRVGHRDLLRTSAPHLIVPSRARGEAGSTPGGDAEELAAVEARLGRPARGRFAVVVRDGADGSPVVIRNEPLLDDGTPMPTRYWLVDPALLRRIGTMENAGGVKAAEAEVDPAALRAAHERYGAERDASLPADWSGPRPSGGVGGTRTGVKCLHTHYANWLATGDDPVGEWVHDRLTAAGTPADGGGGGAG